MNTTEIINSMKEHVAAAYTAVTGKDGIIPEQKNLSNLAAAIDSIQVGSSAENPYKARTYSEMNSYRTKDYANAYIEYTGQRQFTSNQIQNGTIYDKLYFDFPKQIGWIETLDWNNPDKTTKNDSYILKEIHPFDVTIIDNLSKEEYTSPFVWAQIEYISGEAAGLKAYFIYWYTDTSFWVSYGGTPDTTFEPYNAKLKVSNIKEKYYYFIGDIISTTGKWSQNVDGMQFGYKHGTYKIDINSETVDNFQKLDLVLEEGGGGTARKNIVNNYSYNLDSSYDYILKYSYEGKSSSIMCKVGNFTYEGSQIAGAKQLYNITSDGEPGGIYFGFDENCPLPSAFNAGGIVDNFDINNPKQNTPNKSVVSFGSNLYTLAGKTVTIEDISVAPNMIYYTTLPSLSTPAAAADIVKGKQAIDAEGNEIEGTLEPVNNPYAAKNTTELLNYCNEKYEGAVVKVEDLTKTVETEIMVGDAISKLYFNTSITPDFSSLDWSKPDETTDGGLIINILQSEEHFSDNTENLAWDGLTVQRIDYSSKDTTNPYRYLLVLAGWGILWTNDEYSHANSPSFYPVPGWNVKKLNNTAPFENWPGCIIHVKAIKNQDLWKSFISSTQDAWESKYYKIGEPNKNILTSPVNLECRSGNSVDLNYLLGINKYEQYVISLTLSGTTINKVAKRTDAAPSGIKIQNASTFVELDWTNGKTSGINIDFGNNRTVNLFIGDVMDFNDTNHQGQYNSSASTFVINNASSMASGYGLTINSITPISSYDEYHYLTANDRIVATTSDIKKGKGAFNTNGEFVFGTYEEVVLPTLTNEGTAVDLAKGKQLISSSGEIITGTGTIATESGTGDFWVKVIDYDGTVLLEKRGNNGDSFDLPPAPSHEGLVFQEWSASCPITNGKVVIDNNNIMAGAVYTTASGQNEFDITLTKATGLSVALNMDGTKDWGDGTSDTNTTHTYTAYGDYTIKCNGTTMTTSSSSGLFGQTSSINNYYCSGVRFSTIVTNISAYAFRNCYSLAKIVISNTITNIGEKAFTECYSLKNIVIPNNILVIDGYAFCGSGLLNAFFPKGIESIGAYEFSDCASLTKVVLPNGITDIGDTAFQYCYSLEDIIIPDSITTIKDNVFHQCKSLKNIIIPGSVTTIKDYAFGQCFSLIKYDFSQHTTIPSIRTDTFFQKNGIAKIIVPDNLYDEWITKTFWSKHADSIYKASEVTT